MLYLALIFYSIAVLSAIVGFNEYWPVLIPTARLLFFIFLLLSLLAMLAGAQRRKP
jgi:uncharacterized membrane protein YtjA (UPF0391 family)